MNSSIEGAAWFRAATTNWTDWGTDQLISRRGAHRVSVVIPARDEAATIGGIVAAIRLALMERVSLVDELVVIDSDSTDATAAIAADAGADVWPAAAIRSDLGRHAGKGEALWKAQFVTTGDILVFIDADLTGWGPHFVTGLLGPLFADADVLLVKGFYDRVLDDGSVRPGLQGGRVTELVARPLLSLYWPDLREVVQPLAGEWAIRRETFAGLPVPVGYGVEMSTLLDVFQAYGMGAIAQVDLGARAHSHQSLHDLAVMAGEILAVAARRSGRQLPQQAELRQFERTPGAPWRSRPLPMAERPPACTITGYETGRIR